MLKISNHTHNITLCKHIIKEGVKEFYINNVLTPVDNIEFIECPDNFYLDISPSGIQIYTQDIIGVHSETGLTVKSGGRRNKYTLIVETGAIRTYYKFVLMSDGNIEVPGGFL